MLLAILDEQAIDTFLPRRLWTHEEGFDLLIGGVRPQRAQVGEDVPVDVVFALEGTRDVTQLRYVALHRLGLLARVERVLEDLGDGDALLYVLLEHAANEVLRAVVDVRWHCELAYLDLLEERGEVFVVEWESSYQKRVEDDTTGPDVRSRAIVLLAHDDLGCGIVRAATCGEKHVVSPLPDRHAEVCDLNVFVAVEEEVLGLQVAVRDVEAMAVVDSRDDLLEVAEGFLGGEAALAAQVVEELAALDIFKDEVQLGRGLPDVIEAHDVRVLDKLHDDDLALDAVQDAVRLVAETVEGHAGVEEGRLGYDLHRSVLARLGMAGEAYAS